MKGGAPGPILRETHLKQTGSPLLQWSLEKSVRAQEKAPLSTPQPWLMVLLDLLISAFGMTPSAG